MTAGIKLPSARQAVTSLNEHGLPTFTRPWFLFFQQLYDRVGGATAPSITDLDSNFFEDAGSGETNAELFAFQSEVRQAPPSLDSLVQRIEDLNNELAEQRALVAELIKTIQSLQQGVLP